MVGSDDLLTILGDAPAQLATMAAGVPAERLRHAPAPGEWSAVEVLAHLRACADVWGEAIAAIAVQRAETLRAVNPRTWVRSTDYPTLDFAPSLDAFTRQRAELVRLLSGCTDEDWQREATVTGAGRPLVRTPRSYAEWLASHERPHLKQLKRTIDTVRP